MELGRDALNDGLFANRALRASCRALLAAAELSADRWMAATSL
jgi:hypothetical protein